MAEHPRNQEINIYQYEKDYFECNSLHSNSNSKLPVNIL